ncbi:MAG: GTP 3',8-cyclase MoaA [Nitrospirota bacterium]
MAADPPAPERDRHGRAITYLRLSVTDRCNLRCRYCLPAGGVEWRAREGHLTDEEIVRVVSLAAGRGLSKVRLTGGEPLVRPGIVELVAKLARVPGISDLAMTTNGVLLARHAVALKRAGLHRVNVSLDTLDRAKFARITGRDALPQVLEGIDAAEREGLAPVKLNMVVQKGINDDECADLARLTIDRPYHARFIEYMPVADFTRWQTHYLPSRAVMDRLIEACGPLYPCGRGEHEGPALSYRLAGAAGRLGFISAISDEHFCGRCNRMRLTADGKLRPCLFSPVEVDVRTALRSDCSDGALDKFFDHALAVKPPAHELSTSPQERMLVTMITLGG